MRKLALTTGLLILAGASFATTAQAANPFFCNAYAQNAVFQEGQNVAKGCGFFGVRWSFNYAGHYAWCLSATPGMAMAERNARKWMLWSC